MGQRAFDLQDPVARHQYVLETVGDICEIGRREMLGWKLRGFSWRDAAVLAAARVFGDVEILRAGLRMYGGEDTVSQRVWNAPVAIVNNELRAREAATELE